MIPDADQHFPPGVPAPQPSPGGMRSSVSPVVRDLGFMGYRQAWAVQEETHARVQVGETETILIVEHPPVITMGRRGELQGMPNLLASEELLAANGVELIQTDRGGDITFHGPGQIVVYPIIRLADHKLTVGGYVHSLERAVIDALANFNITATADSSAVGVWTDDAKIAAIGVRIRKGVSLHGIALNVSNDLKFFDLIIPCGLKGRSVTSMRTILGDACPAADVIKRSLVHSILNNVLKATYLET